MNVHVYACVLVLIDHFSLFIATVFFCIIGFFFDLSRKLILGKDAAFTKASLILQQFYQLKFNSLHVQSEPPFYS